MKPKSDPLAILTASAASAPHTETARVDFADAPHNCPVCHKPLVVAFVSTKDIISGVCVEHRICMPLKD